MSNYNDYIDWNNFTMKDINLDKLSALAKIFCMQCKNDCCECSLWGFIYFLVEESKNED